MTMIKPTVGRVVWYHPGPNDGISQNEGEPLAAIVASVHGDRLVNLSVIDTYGQPWPRRAVALVQNGEDKPAGSYAEWMPYQKGQAAKTEAVEAQLRGTSTSPGG